MTAPTISRSDLNALIIHGTPLVMTDLASYLFSVPSEGIVGCDALHAIYSLAPTRSGARHMAIRLLAGRLPKGIVPHNPTTVEWLCSRCSIPTLYRYRDGEELRRATKKELAASIEAAKHDGGSGVIKAYVKGQCIDCYATA